MFILRIILSIVAIPIMLVSYLLREIFRIFTLISAKILQMVGALMLLGGIIFLSIGSGVGSNADSNATYIGMIAGGVGIIFLPYIAAFLSGLFGTLAEGIKDRVFH